MTVHPLPAKDDSCPLCGQANGCELDAGVESCWCFSERVSGDLVAWLAAHGKDAACICRACVVDDVRSPCVDVCILDRDGTTCTGCGRTSDEIIAWPYMTPIERAGVHLRLRRASDGEGTTSASDR